MYELKDKKTNKQIIFEHLVRFAHQIEEEGTKRRAFVCEQHAGYFENMFESLYVSVLERKLKDATLQVQNTSPSAIA